MESIKTKQADVVDKTSVSQDWYAARVAYEVQAAEAAIKETEIRESKCQVSSEYRHANIIG